MADWPHQLTHAIGSHLAAPFQWGVSDCALFAGVVAAMTGHDCLAGADAYRTERGARRALSKLGYRTVAALVADHFHEIDPALAQRGDLGYPAGALDALMSPAVVCGPLAYSKNPLGPVLLSRTGLARAFAV